MIAPGSHIQQWATKKGWALLYSPSTGKWAIKGREPFQWYVNLSYVWKLIEIDYKKEQNPIT